MEELKSCLFCGRYVDKTYRYCPHCGFEFGSKEDAEAAQFEPDESVKPPDPVDLPEQPSVLRRLHDMEQILSDMERELDLLISRGKGELQAAGPAKTTSSSRGL